MTLSLYAIVDRRPKRTEELGRGIARQALSLVRAGEAWVVVEPAEPRPPSPRAIVAHDRVIRRISKHVPGVLPLRFGSTAPDRAAVQALLAPLAGSLAGAFDRVRGAVQFTLRVSGARARLPSPRAGGPGTRWLARRIARQQVPEIAAVTEATRPYVREVRVERVDGAGRALDRVARAPRQLASVYHLVAREDVRGWQRALTRAIEQLPHDVTVTTTGPWPPWAFAELA